jgi:hypothetical protein
MAQPVSANNHMQRVESDKVHPPRRYVGSGISDRASQERRPVADVGR